ASASERANSTAGSSSTMRIFFMPPEACRARSTQSTAHGSAKMGPLHWRVVPMGRRIVPLAGIWLLLSSFGSARAQSVPTPPSASLEPGWHIVRPGDTLEALAARYLGSSGFWQRLAKLNADLLDPDRIEPGRRIRVLLLRRTALPVAQIDAV